MSIFVACYKNHLSVTGNRCAAELLNFFKNYKPSRKDGWLIITIEEIREKLFNTWGRDSIRGACKLLDDLGLIKRDHPRLNKRAWMYKYVRDFLDEKPTTVDEKPTTVDEKPTTVDEKPTTTIYKDPDLNPSLDEEANDEKNKNSGENQNPSNPEVSQNFSSSTNQKTQSPVVNQNHSSGSNLPRRRERESFSKPQNNRSTPQWDWIPDGPWKVDEKLDISLIEWQARRWLIKGWGIDIHEARKKVRAYYKNDPTRLANDWQEYSEATAHKLANIAVREENGIAVPQAEKEQLSMQFRAFEPNPHSFSASNIGELEKYKEWLGNPDQPLLNQEREVNWDELEILVDEWEQAQIQEASKAPEQADNPQAYNSSISESDRDWAYQQYQKAVKNKEKRSESWNTSGNRQGCSQRQARDSCQEATN